MNKLVAGELSSLGLLRAVDARAPSGCQDVRTTVQQPRGHFLSTQPQLRPSCRENHSALAQCQSGPHSVLRADHGGLQAGGGRVAGQ